MNAVKMEGSLDRRPDVESSTIFASPVPPPLYQYFSDASSSTVHDGSNIVHQAHPYDDGIVNGDLLSPNGNSITYRDGHQRTESIGNSSTNGARLGVSHLHDDRDSSTASPTADAHPPKKKQKRNKPTLSCFECVERKTKVRLSRGLGTHNPDPSVHSRRPLYTILQFRTFFGPGYLGEPGFWWSTVMSSFIPPSLLPK